MRTTICAGLCLITLAAAAGCTKTKIKNSKVEEPVVEREVIVTEPSTPTTTTTKKTETETTTTRTPPP